MVYYHTEGQPMEGNRGQVHSLAETKAAVPIERVMEFSSLTFRKQGGPFRCGCPVHKGGRFIMSSVIDSPSKHELVSQQDPTGKRQ